jgi:hypothetical protein
MNKKIREKLDSLDLKSLFLTILFFSIGLFLFFYFIDFRDKLRTGDEENFKGQTNGKILTVEIGERIKQSKWTGTEIYVDSYKVKYQFQYQGQTFENIDIIPTTVKNQKLIKKLLDDGANNVISVKFDTSDPNRSLLIETE